MRFTFRQLLLSIFLITLFCSVGSAETELKDEVTGILTEDDSPYHVTANAFVPEDGFLKIESGVRINFEPGTQLEVYGTMNILGNANSPVILRGVVEGNPWKGISINGKDADGGMISYAEISGCTIGIQLSDVDFIVRYTLINALERAISLSYDSNVELESVTAIINADKLTATAIKVKDSYISAHNCDFTITAGGFEQNGHIQGISFDDAEGIFSENHLNVSSVNAVHGIFIEDCSGLQIDHCSMRIASEINDPDHRTAAIRVKGSGSVRLDHMSIDLPSPNVIGIHGSGNTTTTLTNSIIAKTYGNNNGTSFAFYIASTETRTHIVSKYNCYYAVYVEHNNEFIQHRGPYISDNPRWESSAEEDYRLKPESACIDAGDPVSPLDPDGTITDLGRFFYEQASDITGGTTPGLPEKFALESAYPNPFNSSIRFVLNIENNRQVMIRIHDILGREVSTIYSGHLSSGQHSFHWNGFSGFKPVSSGTYFIRVSSDSEVLSQRISLVH